MKPFTHMYIMNVVLEDIKKNKGKVTIPPYGTFEVAENYKDAALDEKCHAYFRAGAIGPDAFPDMVTGQSIIHPGTDKWYPYLEYLMEDETDKNAWAFFAGYKSHLVTDSWTHDWVNFYSGGCWPDWEEFADTEDTARNNVYIHSAIENTLDKRVQAANAESMAKTVSVPVDFLVKAMINSNQVFLEQDGTVMEDFQLFQKPFPLFIYLYWDTLGFENAKMLCKYTHETHKDIAEGLEEWIKCNENVMKRAMENGENMFDVLKEEWSKWAETHALSMVYVPDIFSKYPAKVKQWFESVMPDFAILETIKQFAANEICKLFTGMTVDEFKEMFSHVMQDLLKKALISAEMGEKVEEEIKLAPEVKLWKQDEVDDSVNAAINNSVISTKLAMMNNEELNRLYHTIIKKDTISFGDTYLDILRRIRAIDCGGQFKLGSFGAFYDVMDGTSFSNNYSSYCKNKQCSKEDCKMKSGPEITVSDKLRTIQVRIKTSTRWFSGTDNVVYFGVKFKDGSFDEYKLDKSAYNDFEMGDNDLYYMESKTKVQNMSDVASIHLRMGKSKLDDWRCEYLRLSFNNRKFKKYSVNHNFTKQKNKWSHKL